MSLVCPLRGVIWSYLQRGNRRVILHPGQVKPLNASVKAPHISYYLSSCLRPYLLHYKHKKQ